MIVVSDTGPLFYLTLIGISEQLPYLYGSVYIPRSVLLELQHDHSPITDWKVAIPEWLNVATPSKLITNFTLDQGEREAISLAITLQADVLLIDERAGRNAAKLLGLTVTGTLGVIVDDHAQGLFNGHEILGRLAETSFYASADLMDSLRRKLT
jgi:predicted nucleic acid-binding protein